MSEIEARKGRRVGPRRRRRNGPLSMTGLTMVRRALLTATLAASSSTFTVSGFQIPSGPMTSWKTVKYGVGTSVCQRFSWSVSPACHISNIAHRNIVTRMGMVRNIDLPEAIVFYGLESMMAHSADYRADPSGTDECVALELRPLLKGGTPFYSLSEFFSVVLGPYLLVHFFLLPAPVMALEKDKATKPLHTLLQIFQEKKLEDFQSFLDTNPSTLTEYSLSPEQCIHHMRLLSLCSLATEHEEIPYDAIATTLQIDTKDVEKWVIAAVSSGLLTAKMDQLQRVVMVEKCVVRRFGMEQWKVLQRRLNEWTRNVRSVVEGLKQSQVGQVQ